MNMLLEGIYLDHKDGRRHTLSLNAPPGLASIEVSQVWIKQVFANLISNAKEAMKAPDDYHQCVRTPQKLSSASPTRGRA